LVDVKLNKSDLKRLTRKLDKLKKLSTQELSNEIGQTVFASSDRMKSSVIVDKGGLKQSIVAGAANNKGYVKAKANYAPYIEFGTGRLVDLEDLTDLGLPASYAMQFKGKGIKEVNLPARPFFFSSVRIELAKLLKRLDSTIKKISK
jgi:phage gpG-like protein